MNVGAGSQHLETYNCGVYEDFPSIFFMAINNVTMTIMLAVLLYMLFIIFFGDSDLCIAFFTPLACYSFSFTLS